jgi:glycosyltransferase involved in cell wall biosynthesis
MVTGGSPLREQFGRQAVESFRQQTYAPRELVILNQSLDKPHQYQLLPELFEAGEGYYIREMMSWPMKLGQARNYTLGQAAGDWLLAMDDDDWWHPQRIEWQTAQRDGQKLVVPCLYLAYSFLNDAAYVSRHQWCAGLTLFPRTTRRYDADRQRSEDWAFMDAIPQSGRVRWVDPEEMYLRFYHGENTWDARHVMRQFGGQDCCGRRQCSPAAATYLDTVLAEHYAWAKMLRQRCTQ